jgi:2-amino-4-hydroxy-6-hydroxymethyldihydropteridine diphosphokinase
VIGAGAFAGAAVEPVVIGLGGNVGGDEAILGRFRRAWEALGELGELRAAPLYRTAPIGPAQPAYLNTAVRVRIPDLTPRELISTVLELERLLGRERRAEERWGPRTIDLDVLVWGARALRTEELEVPHPRLAERRFALEPLVALLGEAFEIPGAGAAGALLARVRDQGVVELAASW